MNKRQLWIFATTPLLVAGLLISGLSISGLSNFGRQGTPPSEAFSNNGGDPVDASNASVEAETPLTGTTVDPVESDPFGFQDLFERSSRLEQERRSRSRQDSYGNRGRSRQSRQELLRWENDPEFKHDVFTFARIQYSYNQYYGRNRWGRPDWAVDMPDSDNNFSFRLQQLTSMKVHFEPRGAVVVRLDEEQIYDYPFCYLIEPGEMNLTEPEIQGMRRYLERGGFIMVDDFWGPDEWRNFESQMRRVFPDLRMQELDLTHPIFNIVYKLEQKPQIPSIGHYYQGRTSDRWDANEAHYWELKSKDGKTMMIVCHNTDLGDGWEREGMDQGYFKAYSERFAYPLGINILTYAMTR